MTDPSTLDATAQAELVRNGEITPIELVDAAITRIEESFFVDGSSTSTRAPISSASFTPLKRRRNQ